MKFSLCMIVKDEAAVLRDCLDSLKDIMDEIIIVDTGSTDDTRKIAAEYTPYLYDYVWNDDFAAARNFAFSKATGDYIYSADADEVLDRENQDKFKALKRVMLPEVEIVQMIYVTEQINHPTENFARDLRPKLFKRLREFTWIEPIHETVNVNPVIYDSDIEVRHRPQGNHSSRDFGVFEKIIAERGALSDRLMGMYLRELYKAGTEEELRTAEGFFERALIEKRAEAKELLCRQIIAVLLKIYRIADEPISVLKVALCEEATIPSAEMCMELGYFFMKKEDFEEALKWFHRAGYDCESDIDVASSGTSAFMALALCCRKLAKSPKFKALPQREYELEHSRLTQQAAEYEQLARDWKPVEPTLIN
ncbi:MAG: glycosyltransferase family 2 protein [Lachnospiraceae bacterium]|nr:glycosyltransferase family 2 protein [Lachnospiraceae bacterium]MDE7028785.1 glycosyltransferase family 2 protein [Lachnospiraceae bacterium]